MEDRPRLEIDLELLQQQRWLQEQEELQRVQQKLPEATEDVHKHLNQDNLLKDFTQEQQKQLSDALSVEVAKKSGHDDIVKIDYSKDGTYLVAFVGRDKTAHINIQQTLAQQQPEQQNIFERPLPDEKRLDDINKSIYHHHVHEKLTPFSKHEQQVLMQTIGFALDDHAGRPPKVHFVDINNDQIQLLVGSPHKSIQLDTQDLLAQYPAQPERETAPTRHTVTAKSGDSGMSIAKQLDPNNPEAALGHLYLSGQIKDIQLKEAHQHVVPNIQPNKEYTYDKSLYTPEQLKENDQLGRQVISGQSMANERIDLARTNALVQQQTQIAQLFQNIDHQIANNPNIANGLNKDEIDNLVQSNLSRSQSHSLLNKGVSVAALHKISQNQTLQAAVNRSAPQSYTEKALELAQHTAQNVPFSSIRPLTAQPSMMPIIKMTNHDGKPLTSEQQNAYDKGANEAMFSGLKETVNDANLLAKDMLNTVGYSLLGGLYDQTEASKSIQRNNERIDSLINSVKFLTGSATGQSMYYSAHPDELIKGINSLLVDRQEHVQQLKAEGKFEELGKTDGKISFEVLAAFAPLGMTRKVKSVSGTTGMTIDINLGNNLEKAKKVTKANLYEGIRNSETDFINKNGKSTLERHASKHDYPSKEQYLTDARSFLEKEITATTETFTSVEGTYFRYDSATNEFGIINKYGGISTYFKPEDKLSYWLEQMNRYKDK